MEKGYLQTMQRAAWTKKRHWFSLMPRQGEVLLENHAFKGCDFEAHICKACKKIVLDYSDKPYEEG
jgi:hypothetical protein